MSTGSAIFLTAIVLAFLVFGAVLAWVDAHASGARLDSHPAE